MSDSLFILAALYSLAGLILSAGLRGYSPTERAAWGCFFPLHAVLLFLLSHPKLLTSIGVPSGYAVALWHRYSHWSVFHFPSDIPELLWETTIVFGAWTLGFYVVGGLLLSLKKGLDNAFEEFGK